MIRYEDSELLELLDDESDWAASAATVTAVATDLALAVALALLVRLAAALALLAPLAFALGELPSLPGVDGVVPDELDEEDDELLGDLRDSPAAA